MKCPLGVPGICSMRCVVSRRLYGYVAPSCCEEKLKLRRAVSLACVMTFRAWGVVGKISR